MQPSTVDVNKRVQWQHTTTMRKTQKKTGISHQHPSFSLSQLQPPSPSPHPLMNLILLTIRSSSPLFMQCTNSSSSLSKLQLTTLNHNLLMRPLLATSFSPPSTPPLSSTATSIIAIISLRQNTTRGGCLSPRIRSSCHVLAAEARGDVSPSESLSFVLIVLLALLL